MSEDLRPSGDITTRLIKNNKRMKAKIISNQNCIIGGLNFAKEAFKYSDKKITFETKTKDGKKIKKGKVVAVINGKAKAILKSERVALNFLSLISGVATITKKFVEKLSKSSLFTKNVPDAIDWHFSGTWNHMFQEVPEYKHCWQTKWERSAKLLSRSISLPIFVNKNEDDMKIDGELILNIIKSL